MNADDFRWQAFFKRSCEPLFILNRRGRLLFVNPAWQTLTGIEAAAARGLPCTRRRAAVAGAVEDILGHLLCPPAAVLRGEFASVRRLYPGAPAGQRWWQLEFFPLLDEHGLLGILGKVTLVAEPEIPNAPALPEKVIGLRERHRQHHSTTLFASRATTMSRVGDQVRLAAGCRAPVSLLGERGTGKRWLARHLHEQSDQREQTFLALDAQSLPTAVVGAILFGDGTLGRGVPAGTLFVAEPHWLAREVQERLAHLAGEPDAPRLIVGSSSDPQAELTAGRLLERFHLATSTLTIVLSPLRERREDLTAFVEYFLARCCEDTQKKPCVLTKEAWELVRSYPWPGNLSELLAVLRSAADHAPGETIDAGDLPAALRLAVRLDQTPYLVAEQPLALDKILEEAERRLITLTLRKHRGNVSRAAESLSIWRQRLVRRMEVLGIGNPEKRLHGPKGPDAAH